MIPKKIKNRATGWRPLVLHWRRRRRDLRPILRTDRVSSSVSLSYFPQIHFHFTTHVSNQYQRLAVQTTVNRNRVLFESRWATQMNTNLSSRSSHVNRALRINHINAHLSKHNTSLFASPIPKQIHQRHTSASFTSVFPTRLNTSREESLKVLQKDSHIREHRSQTLSFRSERETIVKQAQIHFDRAEELVWRRAQPRTTVTDDLPVANFAETTFQLPVRTPAVQTPVQSAAAASTQSQPPQITKLDPVLVDRLAEDVIRRVEKRALIERQRRGL